MAEVDSVVVVDVGKVGVGLVVVEVAKVDWVVVDDVGKVGVGLEVVDDRIDV